MHIYRGIYQIYGKSYLILIDKIHDRWEHWVLVSKTVIYAFQSVGLIENDSKDGMLILSIQ